MLSISVITDYQSGRIPNWLILIGLTAGILLSEDVLTKIFIAAIVTILLFPFFRIGALGAGDIKCIAMISFYLTVDQLINAVFLSFLIALIMIGVKHIFQHIFIRDFLKFYSKFKKGFYSQFSIPLETNFPVNKTIETNKIHMAFPILLGVFISVGGTYL